jgi:cupin fold WbuC family metalloprotein
MSTLAARLRQESPEVYYSDGGFLDADAEIVGLLKDGAGRSPKRRCRLCFHGDPGSAQQEMLIVMHRTAYVRPHRHFGKVETLSVIEGSCDALLLDEDGRLARTIPMTPPGQGGSFFYRMPEGLFHTLVFRSEWLVFLETTIGPFSRDMTEAAAWAPDEVDAAAGRDYLAALSGSR